MSNRDPGKYQRERGEEQRRRIMEKLAAGPLSAREISANVHLTHSAVCLHLSRLREAKLVRIAGHRRQRNAREIPLYGLGDAPDVKYVKGKDLGLPGVFDIQRAKVRQAIIAQLTTAPATAPELAVLLKLSNPTMRKYLPKMHAERSIYRAAWVAKDGGGVHVAVWAVGDKPDAPKPKVAKPRKLPNLPEEQAAILKRKREAKAIVQAARARPQNIFSALGL